MKDVSIILNHRKSGAEAVVPDNRGGAALIARQTIAKTSREHETGLHSMTHVRPIRAASERVKLYTKRLQNS